MNFWNETVSKLMDYAARKQSIVNIAEEIKRLEVQCAAIRSASADGTPVKGGGSGREDRLLDNIVKRQELKKAQEDTLRWLDFVNRGLSYLSEDDRQILNRFYINRRKGAANELSELLGVDVKTVYKRKDAALRTLTLVLYGQIES